VGENGTTNGTSPETPSEGVPGDGSGPGRYSLNLARRALAEGWPIEPRVRARIMNRVS
jgi:hypothetical protein